MTRPAAAERTQDECLHLQSELRRLGLECAQTPVLLRSAENWLFRLPAENVLVRNARGGQLAEHLERELRVATLLDAAGVPVLTPVRPEVFDTELGPLSLWPFVQARTPTPEDLPAFATALAALHRVPSSGISALVSQWDPTARAGMRLRAFEAQQPSGGSEDELTFLATHLRNVRARLSACAAECPSWEFLAHGDAHLGNFLCSSSSSLLIDLETVQAAPPEWDLAATVLAVERFGLPAHHLDSFAETLRCDPASELTRGCVEALELNGLTWLAASRAGSPHLAAELEIRMRGVREGSTETWTLC